MAVSEKNLQALTTFANAANDYCDLLASLRDGRPADFYTRLEVALANLHQAILPVEKELPADRRFEDRGQPTEEEQRTVARAIQDAVMQDVSQLAEEHRTVTSSEEDATRAFLLWTDLWETYLDVRTGLNLWQRNDADAQAAAAWEWRFGYESHWGRSHIHRATLTVHELRYTLYRD